MNADTRYGYRAWDRRPGDQVDPSPMLSPLEILTEFEIQNGPPVRAGVWAKPRFMGAERTQPGIVDVLSVMPTSGLLMQDTPTRQDSGMQGTARPALGVF